MEKTPVHALLDELVIVAKKREFYEHYGTHADGKQEYYDSEIQRIKSAITLHVANLLRTSRKVTRKHMMNKTNSFEILRKIDEEFGDMT